MSLQHIQKNSPRLLPKPAKFEKNPPNGYRVIRKTKCGAGGAGSSPIHKQASLVGRLINNLNMALYALLCADGHGESHLICAFFVYNEDKVSLQDMLCRFKARNPKWTDINTAITKT